MRLTSTIVREGHNRNPIRFSMIEDITTRRHTEDALRESEQRLSLVLDATSEGAWDWDLETGRVLFSPHWFESLGYSPNEG